jgi:CDP-glucose 4,6-dehydratase
MGMKKQFLKNFNGKRVLITGHTGFKGSWLSIWLNRLGAKVYGYALKPPTSPSMFDLCNVADNIDHMLGDIRDQDMLNSRISAVCPDIIFHLAAQPIVRLSYTEPLETLTTNIIGTANVLEAARALNAPCVVVVVTSDKCYENNNWVWGYRETDPMGGHDPYSMSKGATELVVSSWRSSYFGVDSPVKLASVRAGNVIGGGDWAQDRIVPDCIRAFSQNQNVELRNPNATRPWQHVLEPLGGYLLIAARLLNKNAQQFCSSWNFGPSTDDVRPVRDIVSLLATEWGQRASWSMSSGPHPTEASILALNCDKANNLLDWRPCWRLEDLVSNTVNWYKVWSSNPTELQRETERQIAMFEQKLTDFCIGERV